ncbi:MAG TPA: isoleucine--tRNA ligase [Verrucomicrobiae bacterium]|nr:isoleucine--tRNA ligase [Verrucomicrobiae bacterium]
MKFQKNTRRRAKEYEKALVDYWKKHKTFEKSIESRPKSNAFVFYDGPPFITGVPHYGTLLSSIVKDAVPRYQTMKGKRVERVWGWDCHGLPAEVFTEKKLGIKDRREIGTKISLEEYIRACRENMVQTGNLWEDTIDRIGRWVDFKGAYKTMDKQYMESVWWAFKTLYEKGKVYEGEKVLMYCTRDATPLSKAEVTMDAGAYQDVTDPSVFVKFKLNVADYNERLEEATVPLYNSGSKSFEVALKESQEANQKNSEAAESIKGDVYLLAWTTTPWTLPANTALAVNEKILYAEVQLSGGDDRFIVAKKLVDEGKIFKDDKKQPLEYVIRREFVGSRLLGLNYVPLFANRGANAHKVWHADYVSEDDGSGVVHLAPAYGEEDFALAKENGIPVVHLIDENGFYTEGKWQSQNVWEVNKPIAKELHGQGVVWKIDYYRHSYPHCHRCGTRLMYRAHPSWFMDIDGQREQMLVENTEHINWFPEHIKHGRFEKNIQQAPDWNLSRDRFWATAMPVWEGVDAAGKKHRIVVGSYAELKELSGKELDDYHRPWVDDIEFDKDGVHYKRIDKVIDGWFESGSMPFAQFHYPFENVEKFEQNFPGDFIVEYIGQVRAWFYYVHAVSVALFSQNAFKNVIVTGTLAGNDGRKMSKSYGNFTDPNELMDTYSADSLRFLLLSSPVLNGEDFALQDKDVADVARKLAMVWNMYDFFTMYADVDGWEWNGDLSDPSEKLQHPLDQWIVSRVHQLTQDIETHMEGYDLPGAVKPILEFLDDASNWYVRRSRKRFWKSEDTADKNLAYTTLHYVLTQTAIVMAPFTPFLAEELYQKLTNGESVHLLDWPKVGHINELLIHEMAVFRRAINDGLSKRAQAAIKVRQPLASAKLINVASSAVSPELTNELVDIVKDELNVKAVELLASPEDGAVVSVELDTAITPELKREGMAREVIRLVQNGRKQAGYDVDDRIILTITTEDKELAKAVSEHSKVIKTETLAVEGTIKKEAFELNTKVEGQDLLIKMMKA